MQTGTPSIGRVITMVLFTLSVVGLMLFLWVSFGGTIPFTAKGYEFKVAFPNAAQLATQADVRIAGVNVGKVVNKQYDPASNRTLVTVTLQNKFAPIHKDATAILRTKTILGETYVQITPGTKNSPMLPDGGTLPNGQVVNAVQLYQVFNTFDPKTRTAFQSWQQEFARAISGNDENLNNVLGNLPTFAADASDILQVLDVQHSSVVSLLQNAGTVFGSLGAEGATLRRLITTGEATFATTAANDNQLAAIFHVFPTFLTQTKLTMTRLQNFSTDADPLIKELEPVATNLGPTLHSVKTLSPYLLRLFNKLGPLITASKTGLPATRDVLLGIKPVLGSLGPFLEQLNPILNWLSLHQQLISDFISNGAYGISGTTTALGGAGLTCNGTPCGHYLRQFGPTGSETFSLYANRDPNNRGNTYLPPLWAADPNNFKLGIYPSWDCKNTGAPGDGSEPADNTPTTGHPACRVAPPLPGATAPYTIPHIQPTQYSSK